MSLAKRETTVPPALRHALAAVGLGLLFGYLGPFGSYPAFGTAARYVFWLGLVLFGYFCALGAGALLRGAALPSPFRIAAMALTSAIPVTFVTAWAISQVQPGRVIGALALPGLFLAVASVQLVLSLAADGTRVENRENPALAEPPRRLAFLSRLPVHLGTDLIAIEAQDHYLRVHTRLGSALILCRLGDALQELEGIEGQRVHRSWWVAHDGVLGLGGDSGRKTLILRNGLNVPVSRTYLADVRARHRPMAGSVAA